MFFSLPPDREKRPAFQEIPTEILFKIAQKIGQNIVGGQTLYGGFSVGACFLLDLENGQKVFVKGAHPGDLSHATQNIRQEINIYKNVPALAKMAPQFLGGVSDGDEDGWHLGIWEHVKTTPTAPPVAKVFSILAETHRTDVPDNVLKDFREQNYIQLFFTPNRKWQRLADEKNVYNRAVGLFVSAGEARAWLDKTLPVFCAHQKEIGTKNFISGLMHGDLHRDNILGDKNRTYIVDWPNACHGPVFFDILFLGAVLESTEGVTIEEVMQQYVDCGGRKENPDSLRALAVCMAGLLMDQASRAIPDKLPRLRWIQKSMLLALLRFLARAGVCESIPRMANQTDA